MSELKMPDKIRGHFVGDDGQRKHAWYLRYHRPDGSVRDYKIHRSEETCTCQELAS